MSYVLTKWDAKRDGAADGNKDDGPAAADEDEARQLVTVTPNRSN